MVLPRETIPDAGCQVIGDGDGISARKRPIADDVIVQDAEKVFRILLCRRDGLLLAGRVRQFVVIATQTDQSSTTT